MAKTKRPDWERIARAALHPVRVRIIEYGAATEDFSAKALSDHFGEPISNVSYHVRALRDMGALEEARTEQHRGAVQVYYRVVRA